MSDDERPRLVWSPYRQPSHPEKPQEQTPWEAIRIKHPNYDAPLLTFPPLDAGGVHHETVRVACAILDDNRWDGFLSFDRQGEQRVPASEIVLRAGIYYFQTSPQSSESNYALTPTFQHWRFPEGDLPPSWRDIASFEQASRPGHDSYCRITQYHDGVENAHLVPTAEREWFLENMATSILSTRIDKLKHPDNSIRLRSDIHTVFDAKRFAIVPIEGRLVAYCMNTGFDSQVARLYHGVELHRLDNEGCLDLFLFSRFAYTVFEHLRGFLESNCPKKLRLRVENETVVELCDTDRCRRFAQSTAYQGKSRSASLKKRPYADAEPVDSDDEYYVDDDDDDDDDDGREAESRGRKRRRSDGTESSYGFAHSSTIDCSSDSSIRKPGTSPFPAPKFREPRDVDAELEAGGTNGVL